jgi:hypothetical protein
MVYLIYGFGGLFVVLSCAMLYAFYRGRDFGLFIMGVTYGASGVLALALPHWWPLVAGFVLVWLLKLLGLEPRVEPAEGGPGEKTEPQSQGTDKN